MIAAGSTQGDVTNIGAACQSVASDQGIDARVLLALILQESTGYVGVTTTTNVDGAGTGGLMQASECEGYPGQSGLSAVRVLNHLVLIYVPPRPSHAERRADRRRRIAILITSRSPGRDQDDDKLWRNSLRNQLQVAGWSEHH